MKLTDIESYGALYKGSKGESGCACENSTPGLPNLEPQLKVRHAELITSLKKRSTTIQSMHAVAVSGCFSAKISRT